MVGDYLAAAHSGAQSVPVHGWYRAECDAAAREAVIRRHPTSAAHAWQIGRSAAIDELRRLTHARSPLVCEPRSVLPDTPIDDARLDNIEHRLDQRTRRRLTDREAEVVAHLAAGHTKAETARLLGLDPSRVTQLGRAAARKLARE